LDAADEARKLHETVHDSHLYDDKLGMYRVNASLEDQPHDIGRARAFSPGWLENGSIWLHMSYKYLLELLRAGLYEQFFAELPTNLVPFMDPAVYGRSPLENSSFIVSSAHPDESLHGAGFVARLSGSTAEFLSMWQLMMSGPQPFVMNNGELQLALRPICPATGSTRSGKLSFRLLGKTLMSPTTTRPAAIRSAASKRKKPSCASQAAKRSNSPAESSPRRMPKWCARGRLFRWMCISSPERSDERQ
jgi:hypothetical protein